MVGYTGVVRLSQIRSTCFPGLVLVLRRSSRHRPVGKRLMQRETLRVVAGLTPCHVPTQHITSLRTRVELCVVTAVQQPDTVAVRAYINTL